MPIYVFEIILENTSQMMPKQTHDSKIHNNFLKNEVFGLECSKS